MPANSAIELVKEKTIMVILYGAAIHNAIKTGDKRTMVAVLKHAKKVYREQGDLKKAIKELERAIEKIKT